MDGRDGLIVIQSTDILSRFHFIVCLFMRDNTINDHCLFNACSCALAWTNQALGHTVSTVP